MRWPVAIVLVAMTGLLAGCGLSQKLQQRIIPDTASIGGRCADIMRRAMPFAAIDIGRESADSPDIRIIVAHVAGTRTDTSDNSQVARDLAVDCTFTDNVLTAFRWTKGGPLPPPTSETPANAPPANAPPTEPPSAAPTGATPPSSPARPPQ